MKKKMVKMSAPGKKPISFKKGALHAQLGVPQGQPIPAAKKKAALAGKDGPLAKKRAAFAFKGALKAGRKTVAESEGKREKGDSAKEEKYEKTRKKVFKLG